MIALAIAVAISGGCLVGLGAWSTAKAKDSSLLFSLSGIDPTTISPLWEGVKSATLVTVPFILGLVAALRLRARGWMGVRVSGLLTFLGLWLLNGALQGDWTFYRILPLAATVACLPAADLLAQDKSRRARIGLCISLSAVVFLMTAMLQLLLLVLQHPTASTRPFHVFIGMGIGEFIRGYLPWLPLILAWALALPALPPKTVAGAAEAAPASPVRFRPPYGPAVLSVLSVLGCLAAYMVWRPRPLPDSGIELGYRIDATLVPGLEATVRRRLEALDIAGSRLRVEKGVLILQLPGATPETSARVRRIFRSKGALQLSMVAPLPLQQRFLQDKRVPEGYTVVENRILARGGDYEAYDSQILVLREPIIEGRHIVQAEARKELHPGGDRWVTSVEMTPDGARLFDDAAKILYDLRPSGLVAILLDGVLRSAPAVQSPAFHGQAQISGAKDEEEAKDLAIILRTGALPVPLADPAFERPYGPQK